jgi:ferritin
LENVITDREIQEMIDLCLERENSISTHFNQLTEVLERKYDK